MPLREIIDIDEEKCTGCGECLPNCAEGALQVVNGKARLVSDDLCDGLGACLGHCPEGALRIIKREAPSFDEAAVEAYLAGEIGKDECTSPECVGAQVPSLDPTTAQPRRQWPIAIRLVPVKAPFFEKANLLITADCVPFAYRQFHEEFMPGRVLVYGCPKFDDAQSYVEKLTAIFQSNDIQSISLVMMEVPCCTGLKRIVEQAITNSGKSIPLQYSTISVLGNRK